VIYEVVQGDCLNTIAYRFRFADYKLIYDHPQNKDFKKKRPNPNVIYPGDQIFIPPLRLKQTNGSTDKTHRFVCKTPKVHIQVYFELNQEPYADRAFTLTADGSTVKGTTSSKGLLKADVPIEATTARVVFDKTHLAFTLEIGNLDPITEVSGMQDRLNNLGYDCGDEDGELGPLTTAALMEFQRDQNLTETGEFDSATQDSLKKSHDKDTES
jgi:Putative peptidoglycan binding domain